MRLIDADALKQYCEEHWIPTNFDAIDAQPTVDAVPVVRCKNCKWWAKQEESIQGRCALLGMYPTGAWYCANGAKMDEVTDGKV